MTWLGAALALLSLPLQGIGASLPDGCSRACLMSLLDRYLAAVVAHDPTAATLAVGYRHTENAINVPQGQGVWRTVTGLGPVQRRYLDPDSSQAAYYGIVQEGTHPVIVTARLRIEHRRITEAEWYIARDGDPGLPNAKPPNAWNPQGLTAMPPPQRALPAAQRLSR